MKAFGKILGLVLLGLLLIIVALGFALTHLFDPIKTRFARLPATRPTSS